MFMCAYVHMCVHVPICVNPHVFVCKRGGLKTISAVILRYSLLCFIFLLLLCVSVISVCKAVYMSWNMCRCQRIASRSRFFPPRDGAQVVRLAQKAPLPNESSH